MDNSYSIAEMTSAVPKVIDQKAHAVLDYTTAATLLGLGFKLRHQHRRASNFAFMNAASVLVASMMTDYPGGLFKRLSFKQHGMMDVMQASMLAVGPALLGFGGDPEAKLFYAQAAMEAGVVAATDWNASAAPPASFA